MTATLWVLGRSLSRPVGLSWGDVAYGILPDGALVAPSDCPAAGAADDEVSGCAPDCGAGLVESVPVVGAVAAPLSAGGGRTIRDDPGIISAGVLRIMTRAVNTARIVSRSEALMLIWDGRKASPELSRDTIWFPGSTRITAGEKP